MEENKKMSKSTKIILGILIAIVCICVAFFAMSNVKKSKAKKEYKNLLEKEMDNISQDYNLSKVTVQVTGIKKRDINYSLDAIIDCECDNNNALIFDDGNNEEYDYDQVIYDYDQLVLFEEDIEYAVYHASNDLTTIKSEGDDNWLLHTTVTLNGSGTVKTRFFFVFCSVISNLYLSPSLTISESRRLRISDILSPRFPSKTRAVAIRSLGRQPQNPSLMV